MVAEEVGSVIPEQTDTVVAPPYPLQTGSYWFGHGDLFPFTATPARPPIQPACASIHHAVLHIYPIALGSLRAFRCRTALYGLDVAGVIYDTALFPD